MCSVAGACAFTVRRWRANCCLSRKIPLFPGCLAGGQVIWEITFHKNSKGWPSCARYAVTAFDHPQLAVPGPSDACQLPTGQGKIGALRFPILHGDFQRTWPSDFIRSFHWGYLTGWRANLWIVSNGSVGEPLCTTRRNCSVSRSRHPHNKQSGKSDNCHNESKCGKHVTGARPPLRLHVAQCTSGSVD